MIKYHTLCVFVIGLSLAAGSGVPARADEAGSTALRFSVAAGRVQNEFFRQDAVAAHLVLTSGPAPRLVVAFPAGNSGAALWFERGSATVQWRPDIPITAARREVPEGLLHGITAELEVTGGPLTIRQVILSSVRVIRDYGYTGDIPSRVETAPQLDGRTATWRRQRLDGAAGYLLSLEVLIGRLDGVAPMVLEPGIAGKLKLRVTALTGDPPLTPLDEGRLLSAAARPDPPLRRMLAFLSYEEKLLAGSWRFNTYFGRDTLMSLQLLMPVLEPPVVEAGLGAVLERLGPDGDVAHEEDIGEYAALRHLRDGLKASSAPVYDYKMIDDDFLLPIVAARYLLDTPAGRARARGFLSRRTGAGARYGDALLRNFGYVLAAAEGFAAEPDWRNLVSLQAGIAVGNWRDSEEGLGGGRFPYDVNGVFVPAALAAVARLSDSGLLGDYMSPKDRSLSQAASMADVWLRKAPPLFEVRRAPEAAAAAVEQYARRVGVEPAAALDALDGSPVAFKAVALDATGSPIAVINSDQALTLLFLELPGKEVERSVATLMRPFPAGLLTGVGPVVANPAYAGEAMEASFGRSRYHGTVVWSWQQAMLAAGIDRQLQRDDLNDAAHAVLGSAQASLRSVIDAVHAVRGSELWSWSQKNGTYRVEPFGQRQEDETESNAAQLWSTVYLALPDP
jgi:hypothetical protein